MNIEIEEIFYTSSILSETAKPTHKNWVNGDPLQSIQMSSKFMKEHFR